MNVERLVFFLISSKFERKSDEKETVCLYGVAALSFPSHLWVSSSYSKVGVTFNPPSLSAD